MDTWNDCILGQRKNVVHALLSGNKKLVMFEAYAMKSLLDLLYGRECISWEFFEEQQDFADRCIRASQ
jgi:hypothetical protein